MVESIIVEKETDLTIVTLNREKVLNAFDWDSLHRLQAAVAEFEKELARLNVEAKIVQTGSVGYGNFEPLVIISKPDYPRICYNNVTPEAVGTP